MRSSCRKLGAVGPNRIEHFCYRTTAVALPNLPSSITVGYEVFLRELTSEVLIRTCDKRKGSGRIPDCQSSDVDLLPRQKKWGESMNSSQSVSPSRYERAKEFLAISAVFSWFCCLAVTTHDRTFLLLHHKEV